MLESMERQEIVDFRRPDIFWQDHRQRFISCRGLLSFARRCVLTSAELTAADRSIRAFHTSFMRYSLRRACPNLQTIPASLRKHRQTIAKPRQV
jgi:hypothetical protein